MHESCHTHEWVKSHTCMSRVTHMYESRYTHEWVGHIWMSQVTHMNGSCHTYEWVMSHIWRSHVTHLLIFLRLFVSNIGGKRQGRRRRKYAQEVISAVGVLPCVFMYVYIYLSVTIFYCNVYTCLCWREISGEEVDKAWLCCDAAEMHTSLVCAGFSWRETSAEEEEKDGY